MVGRQPKIKRSLHKRNVSLQTPKIEAEWKQIACCYKSSGSLFYNYKGYCSVQMMALIDANYCFTYLEVGAEGRLGDGGHRQSSKLKLAIDKNKLHLPTPSPLPGKDIQLSYAIVCS